MPSARWDSVARTHLLTLEVGEVSLRKAGRRQLQDWPKPMLACSLLASWDWPAMAIAPRHWLQEMESARAWLEMGPTALERQETNTAGWAKD